MKKLLALLLLFCLGVTLSVGQAAAASPTAVHLDGQPLTLAPAPYTFQNNVMVPVRSTFEQLGATVSWQPSTRQVEIQSKQGHLLFTVGSAGYLKDGQKATMTAPLQLIGNRAFVPVRLVSTVMAFDIRWLGSANTVQLCTMGCDKKAYPKAPAMTIDKTKTYIATVKTNDGDFQIKLLADKAPIAVNNFVFLARDHYYDNVTFYRIVKDFIIQTGDPTGTGSGGPGYTFRDELPPAVPYAPGVVAMANYGPNTNGSQFFIGTGDEVRNLNQAPYYTVFGEVISGMDVVEKIANTPVTASDYGEISKPTQDVHIISVQISN